MKNILYLFVVLFAFASCSDDDVSDALASNVEATTADLSFTDVVNGIYEGGVSASVAGFTITGDLSGFSSYELYVQKGTDGNTLSMIANGTSLPTAFEFTLGEIASATGVPTSEWNVGDNANFVVKLLSGSNNSYFSEDTFTIPVSCPSNLGGTYEYVATNLVSGAGGTCTGAESTSGTVTWTATGAGNYSTTDLGFGQFAECWGDSPANSASAGINETCGKLSVFGADQYGDTYTYSIVEINGNVLTMNFSNSYGDGGTVTLTRTDGTDWPELTT